MLRSDRRELEFSRRLPFGREAVFDLVADVERYPEFLPGWQAARILRRDGERLLVEQTLGGMGVRQRFQTRAQLQRPERITIEGDQAPFRRLHQTWEFIPEGEQATQLRFRVDYTLRGALLGPVIDRFCEHVFRETMDAFERRARGRLK